MASFTDTNIPKFNPYVQQLPVEAMVQVGMDKQKRYEEGVTKIQNQINNIAGMDVMRDVDKNYLQSRLNQLGSDLTTVAAGDFSNFQLVNSVGGMATQISKDRNVQNAVSSTAWYRKQAAQIQKDIDEGKSDPSNVYKFQKQASAWLDSKNAGDKFNSSYTPHFNIFKFAKETFDAVKPDEFSFDEIYQLGADGKPLQDKQGNLIYSPTMTRLDKKGIFPEKVKETLTQIFSDPRVAQQLQITGEYNYRNETPEVLSNRILGQKQKLLSSYDAKYLDLTMQKNLGKDVQKQIDELETAVPKIGQTYNDYANLALSNPEAVKGQMYKDDVTTRYTTMFGHIADKSQVMENPAWKAQFDMQKEANEQSRFAQRLKFDISKETSDNQWKQKEFDQRDRLAILAASTKLGKKTTGAYGAGSGPGGETPEQANQESYISKVHNFEQSYDKDAETFINSSDNFIWKTLGLDNPTNLAYKSKLMSSGKTEDEAIHIIMNTMAKTYGETPEAWRTKWGDKATKAYQNMSAADKQKNPLLADAYSTYKSSRRIYDNAAIIKKQVEAQTTAQTGDVSNKIKLTEGIENQTINFQGDDVKLSKDDVYDMAVYLRGYKSSIALFNDEGARNEANAAYKRMEQRGTSGVADAVLDRETQNPFVGPTPITGLTRTVKTLWRDIKHPLSIMDVEGLRKQVRGVFNKIDTEEYANGLKVKAEIIDKAMGMKPNLKQGLLTGDSETDKQTNYTISRWAGEYSDQNLSHDFSEFKKNINSDVTKNTFSAQTIMDAYGNPQIEIVLYDPKSKERLGGMTIQPDEAEKLNLDVNTLYEPKQTSSLRNKINFNGGQSCVGDIKDITTYTQGDAYFDIANKDFPLLENTPYDVQANIKYSNGKYFPYIYVKGAKSVRELPGVPDLQSVMLMLQTQMTPTFAKKILIEQ